MPADVQGNTPPVSPQSIDSHSDMLYDLYDGSNAESDDEDDARNIENWMDEVDGTFDVFGMDGRGNEPSILQDPNLIDIPREDPDDIDDLLQQIEFHRFYRNVGRQQWKQFQQIADRYYNRRVHDGDTYGRRVHRRIPLYVAKIDRCELGHIAYTGGFAEATKCTYNLGRTECGKERYRPKTNPGNEAEVLRPVSQLDYIPLQMRLVEQFRNAIRARELQTSYQRGPSEAMTDWVDGRIYQRLKADGYFSDAREIALQMSLDEITLTNKKVDARLHKVMVVFVYILNLDPEVRFNKSNTLLSIVIPGGYDNSTLDTFLQPLVDECRALSRGVPAIDASRGGEDFTLKAHLVLVTGDGRAVAKAMGMKEPGNALYPCRTCEIKATHGQTKHYYIPHTYVDVRNLPFRQNMGSFIDTWTPSPHDSDAEKGITRRSLLRKIPSLYWPDSFPVDTMHCIAHNLTQDVFRLLWGAKWAKLHPTDPSPPYCVRPIDKVRISEALRDARRTVPASVAPPPREIQMDDIKRLKTAEWKAFLLVYGPAILQGAIPTAYWKNFCDLSHLYSLLLHPTVRPTHVNDIRDTAERFVKQHEKLYYTDFREVDTFPRIQVCTLQRHSLLHLADDVLNWGPASIFAQWLPEGYLGYIKSEADSPSHMIRSLINGVLDDDRYNIALYRTNMYRARAALPTQVFLHEKSVTLTRTTLSTRLRAWMAAKDDFPIDRDLGAQIFGSYQIATGALVTPLEHQRSTDVNRQNCYIAYFWSGAPTSPMQFGEVMCFAWVYSNSIWDLAFVKAWRTRNDNGYYTKIGNLDSYWFEARLIVGLVGVVTVQVGHTKRKRIVGKDGIYNEVERDM